MQRLQKKCQAFNRQSISVAAGRPRRRVDALRASAAASDALAEGKVVDFYELLNVSQLAPLDCAVESEPCLLHGLIPWQRAWSKSMLNMECSSAHDLVRISSVHCVCSRCFSICDGKQNWPLRIVSHAKPYEHAMSEKIQAAHRHLARQCCSD